LVCVCWFGVCGGAGVVKVAEGGGRMNAETERRLAAMIMEEANVMRQRAEKDGVGAYLLKPVVKARPNRQFLTAMVRGVQHGACASVALFMPCRCNFIPDFFL
jgi:hypothetical protein